MRYIVRLNERDERVENQLASFRVFRDDDDLQTFNVVADLFTRREIESSPHSATAVATAFLLQDLGERISSGLMPGEYSQFHEVVQLLNDEATAMVKLLSTKSCNYRTATALGQECLARDQQRAVVPTVCAKCAFPPMEIRCSHVTNPKIRVEINGAGQDMAAISSAGCDRQAGPAEGVPGSRLPRGCEAGGNGCWEAVLPSGSAGQSEPVPEVVMSARKLNDLLAAGESQTVEYKSTARWNLRTKKFDKKMEHVIAKTVCGLLNGDGGSLIIGVDDDSKVLGLDSDYATLGNKGNRDGMELWLRQHLENNLSVVTARTVTIYFDAANGKDVCIVSVLASPRPVFAKPHEGGGDPSEFWVRVGNATKQLYGNAMVQYQQDHWS